jgi:hypothetical protein
VLSGILGYGTTQILSSGVHPSLHLGGVIAGCLCDVTLLSSGNAPYASILSNQSLLSFLSLCKNFMRLHNAFNVRGWNGQEVLSRCLNLREVEVHTYRATHTTACFWPDPEGTAMAGWRRSTAMKDNQRKHGNEHINIEPHSAPIINIIGSICGPMLGASEIPDITLVRFPLLQRMSKLVDMETRRPGA